MDPMYQKGQQVVVKPVKNQSPSLREADLGPYVGQRGVVTDYYWVSLGGGVRAFYIYTVQIGDSQKEVVLHEDELEPFIG